MNDKKTTTEKNSQNIKTETVQDLKDQTVKSNTVKKGYNEQNPIQPQGAFTPDNAKPNN